MKIDYLSASELISDAANAVHVMRMSAALTSLGHEVTLHALKGQGSDTAEVFAYYGALETFGLRRYRQEDLAPVRLILALRWLSLPVGPLVRLLHGRLAVRPQVAGGPESLIYARNPEWLLACLAPDSRFIFESHAPPADFRDRLIHRGLFRHPGFLSLVVISEPLKAAYLAAYPDLPFEKIIVAHDAADEVELSEDNQGGERRFQVGYVGQLYAGRGGELMVDIARALPEADFHLVGGRPEDIARLKALAPAPNLIFHGHQPPARLGDFYRRFDAVLAPYQAKVTVAGGTGNTVAWMSPLKIFEYMSLGKAIIASDLPVLHEVLTPGETAIMVVPYESAAWVEALRRIIDNPMERKALERRARDVFKANYTWHGRARRILAVLGARADWPDLVRQREKTTC